MKYYHSSKSIKHQFEIYGDFQTLLEKIDSCEKNPKKYFTMDASCGFAI